MRLNTQAVAETPANYSHHSLLAWLAHVHGACMSQRIVDTLFHYLCVRCLFSNITRLYNSGQSGISCRGTLDSWCALLSLQAAAGVAD